MINVPDFMPKLRRGAGLSPKDGGCLIQVAGWLNDGVSWTDATPCVHPLLRDVGTLVNDQLVDGERQELMRLAPRLIGTGTPDDQRQERMVTEHLALWAARHAKLKAASGNRIAVYLAAYMAEMAHGLRPNGAILAAARDAAATRYDMVGSAMGSQKQQVAEKVKFLEDALDEYDWFTGREVSGATVSLEQWQALADAMAV